MRIIAVVMVFVTVNANAVDVDAWNAFIDALIAVESNGDDKAIGDGGKALGCLQIHSAVIEDVNSIYDRRYKHRDAFNRRKAKRICLLYLLHYGKWYVKTHKRQATMEVLARMWNGGPYGHKKQSTLNYWDKVKSELEKRMEWIK